MHKSRYESRAAAIHGDKFLTKEPEKDIPPQKFWKEQVNSKQGVKLFYERYYPYLPDVLIDALADHIQAQVEGRIPPTEQFYAESEQNKKIESMKWDYKKELEEELFKGKMALAEKRMQELLKDEEENDH